MNGTVSPRPKPSWDSDNMISPQLLKWPPTQAAAAPGTATARTYSVPHYCISLRILIGIGRPVSLRCGINTAEFEPKRPEI